MNKKILILVVICAVTVFVMAAYPLMAEEVSSPEIDGIISAEEYSNYKETDIGMSLYWELDDEYLYIGLVSPGSGWLAFGLEPTLRMEDAKIYIAALTEEELKFETHLGTSPTGHSITEEDYTEKAAANYENDELVFETKIPLSSEDFPGIELKSQESYSIILAYHNSSTSFSTRHSARTTIEIEL